MAQQTTLTQNTQLKADNIPVRVGIDTIRAVCLPQVPTDIRPCDRRPLRHRRRRRRRPGSLHRCRCLQSLSRPNHRQSSRSRHHLRAGAVAETGPRVQTAESLTLPPHLRSLPDVSGGDRRPQTVTEAATLAGVAELGAHVVVVRCGGRRRGGGGGLGGRWWRGRGRGRERGGGAGW